MLDCHEFYKCLRFNGIDFFAGVPDSLLKDICACIADRTEPQKHIITANEGAAIAISAGYHLATGKTGFVYLQNSGLGNSINPLSSLTDPEVYGIPVLLLIGWRGEPGVSDEPQHKKQGRITLKMLETLEIPFSVLPASIEEASAVVSKACQLMRTSHTPYALVARKGAFGSYSARLAEKNEWPLFREETIKLILEGLPPDSVVISTTGKISRELFEYREKSNHSHERDFLTLGSMGHCSQIALGIALATPDRQVVCLDGDGALIMHMGSLGIIGSNTPSNLKHIVINNGAHESVGGQPTVGFDIDIPAIARACGYLYSFSAFRREDLIQKLRLFHEAKGPALLEIRTNKESRQDLGRPNSSPSENKRAFMNFLRGNR